MNSVTIKIPNDVSVTVPAQMNLMTTFVLHEQHDWFEDEIKFIRTYLKPGMKAIDIGANYGTYALTMAKLVGDTGKVWAFEPTEATANCLRESIAENHFQNFELIQAGLSNRIGQAELYTASNSELNSLTKEAVPGAQHETIDLLTLDHCFEQYPWDNIDFIKLDAEGEEINILMQAEKALTYLSPLIMFELKHGKNVNLPLINRFAELGYKTYRLVPGLNTLIPFDHTKPFDSYLLNLFCCKNDRADQLATSGVIVRDWSPKEPDGVFRFEEQLAVLPYVIALKKLLPSARVSQDYRSVLEAYFRSQSDTETALDRVGYLMYAVNKMKNLMANNKTGLAHAVSYTRIAFAAGERELGVQILQQLLQSLSQQAVPVIDDVFLPATARYEHVVPQGNYLEWLVSSIIEQYIQKHAFSTYFTAKKSLAMYAELSRFGFMDAEMARRYELLRGCVQP